MYKVSINIVLIALFLMSGVSHAQMARSFFPWWEMGFTRDLNLSEQQQQQIREILRENRSKMIDMRAAMEKAEGDVEDLFEESNIDQRKANDVVERVVSARSNMTRQFTMMSLQMRRVLTNEQWKDLQTRRSRFENMRRPGGPGGPMGAGAPGGPGHGGDGPGSPRRQQGERKGGPAPQNQPQ
jgi:Spy/CpxP family protein refolding chaperone